MQLKGFNYVDNGKKTTSRKKAAIHSNWELERFPIAFCSPWA